PLSAGHAPTHRTFAAGLMSKTKPLARARSAATSGSGRTLLKHVLASGASPFQPAIAQEEDAIKAIKNLLVVGHGDNCRTLLDGNPAQQIHDDAGTRRIKGRGRLIGKDDAGPVCE